MTDIVRAFPHPIQTIDPAWIVAADGTRIATTLWRPVVAHKVPVVVEMLPFRRRDGTVFRDLEMIPYLVGHGIAYCRVDIRGSGDSDGILEDEYLPREQEDALQIIDWLSRQDWCNGNVGMTGISWGGCNALQVAALRPPALKAIITLCSSDDRYSDDVHFKGGALLTEDAMWSNVMLAMNSMPPDPQIVGERWREMWMARLAANHSWSEHWLSHQRRDAYWKQGSVCENHAAITCAVLALGGWEDFHSNAVPRLLSGLKCARKAIIGPWSHDFPCRSVPGPPLGYLQEALRWWNHWLMDEPSLIMDEPLYRVWIGTEERPRPWYENHPGTWVAEDTWPSQHIYWRTRYLNERGLGETAMPGHELGLSCPANAGTDFGRGGGYGGGSPDLAIDQRREDGQSLSFDSEFLAQDLTLLGAAEVDLEIIVDQPQVNLVLRLCDVFPDGTSAVMTHGVLNLAHRNSHEVPEPCPIGTPFRVKVRLDDVGRTIPKGHRLRLSLQNQFWSLLWPQPRLSTIRLKSGTSTLRLPFRPFWETARRVFFKPAELSTPVPVTASREESHARIVEDDLVTGLRTIRQKTDFGAWVIEDRAIAGSAVSEDTFVIHAEDPLRARLASEYRWSMKSGEADVAGLARTELSADSEQFHLVWRIEATEAGKVVFSNGRTRSFPRDGG